MSEAISGEMASGDVGGGVDTGAVSDPVSAPVDVSTPETAEPAAAEQSFTGIEYEGIESAGDPTPAPVDSGEGWWSGQSTDDIAFIQNKGWHHDGKGIGDVIKAYRLAESKIGGDPNSNVLVPNWDDPAQVSAFNDQMGVPSSADAYPDLDIQTARGKLEVGPIAKISAAAGLRPDQHAIFAQMAGDLISDTANEQESAAQLTRTADQQRLVQSKGQDAKAFLGQVRTGREAVGIDDSQRDALYDSLGVEKAMGILAMIGESTGEHRHPSDENQPIMEGVMSQEVALERLKQRRADKNFFAKMEANDPDALKEWSDLNAAAATRDN